MVAGKAEGVGGTYRRKRLYYKEFVQLSAEDAAVSDKLPVPSLYNARDINYYQDEAYKTAITYEGKGVMHFVYPVVKLAGETGEFCDKVGKYLRNGGEPESVQDAAVVLNQHKQELKAELGDILWYIACFCTRMGFRMEDVLYQNLAKIRDRAERNVIKSEGDNR